MKDEPIGKAIARRMEQLGLNQRSLALKAGLHEDAVRNILRGKSKHPRIDTMEKIQKVLWGQERARAPFTGFAEHTASAVPRKPVEREAAEEVDVDMLVNATLLVRELFEGKKLSPQDIKETALAACRLAVQSGTHFVNRTLVLYLREAMEEQERRLEKS